MRIPAHITTLTSRSIPHVSIGWYMQPIRQRGLSGFPKCFHGASDWLTRVLRWKAFALHPFSSSLLPASDKGTKCSRQRNRHASQPIHTMNDVWVDARYICMQSFQPFESAQANRQHPKKRTGWKGLERGDTLSVGCWSPACACLCTCDFLYQHKPTLTMQKCLLYISNVSFVFECFNDV